MKKKSMVATSLALCLALAVSPGTLAYAAVGGEDAGEGGAPEIYVPDNYQDPGIMPLERGQCTDVYSKAWCDAHGYKNNRPVGHMVKLTKKERDCYYKALAAGVWQSATALVTGSVPTALMAPPAIAYKFFTCLM